MIFLVHSIHAYPRQGQPREKERRREREREREWRIFSEVANQTDFNIKHNRYLTKIQVSLCHGPSRMHRLISRSCLTIRVATENIHFIFNILFASNLNSTVNSTFQRFYTSIWRKTRPVDIGQKKKTHRKKQKCFPSHVYF